MQKVKNNSDTLVENVIDVYLIDISDLIYEDVLKETIAKYDANATLKKNDHGKPILSNSKINISISHSKNMLFLAFSLNPNFGVDIEHEDVVSLINPLGILDAEEYLLTLNLNDFSFSTIFCKIWCLKESFFKMKGYFCNMARIYQKKDKDISYSYFYKSGFVGIIIYHNKIKKINIKTNNLLLQ
jgi:phosphopantetheinyl transferase (holo-ACP synthase)